MKNIKEEELREEAIEMLNNDDELFVDMVNELDNCNGFAGGFRGYPMCELEDHYISIHDLINDMTSDFNINDEYFIQTIYGLESTDDLAAYYHDNVDTDDLIDNLIDKYYGVVSVTIYDSDLDEIIKQLADLEETA